jgi:hypothetical protein
LEGSNIEVSIKTENDVLVSVSVDAAVTGVSVVGFSITELILEDASSTYNGGVTALGDSAGDVAILGDTAVSVDTLSLDTNEESTPFSPVYIEGLADTAMTGLVLITDVLTTSAFSDTTVTTLLKAEA